MYLFASYNNNKYSKPCMHSHTLHFMQSTYILSNVFSCFASLPKNVLKYVLEPKELRLISLLLVLAYKFKFPVTISPAFKACKLTLVSIYRFYCLI